MVLLDRLNGNLADEVYREVNMMAAAGMMVLSIVLSAIAAMAIGGLWFSPALFGRAWMQLSGKTKHDMEKAKKEGMGAKYLGAFIGTLVMAFVLSRMLVYAGTATAAQGVVLGFLAWLGFVAPVQFGIVLWEGKPVQLFFLNTAHELVSLVIMGAILGGMA
ncbi:DUF1761 domain-containing protein [Candidatus Woesearchaeota archaeon]|nr:DUF1761 domain-containing protein [Candidatus Woesearchaeota archaeon]